MDDDALPPDDLTPDQQAQWQADLEALHSLHHDQDASPLLLGDLYLQLHPRWGKKMPLLARLAGFHPFTLRRRARVAELIPPGHPLRASSLPYPILRLLAPIPQPQRWVQRAQELQAAGELRIRSFYQMLLDAGARGRRSVRAPHPPRCLRCHHELPEDSPRFHFHRDSEEGYLCNWECAQAYLEAEEDRIAYRAERAGLPTSPPDPPHEDFESQSRGQDACARSADFPIGDQSTADFPAGHDPVAPPSPLLPPPTGTSDAESQEPRGGRESQTTREDHDVARHPGVSDRSVYGKALSKDAQVALNQPPSRGLSKEQTGRLRPDAGPREIGSPTNDESQHADEDTVARFHTRGCVMMWKRRPRSAARPASRAERRRPPPGLRSRHGRRPPSNRRGGRSPPHR